MRNPLELLVIGASAGGINALGYIFQQLDEKYPLPILVTKHLGVQDEDSMLGALKQKSVLPVKIAMDKEHIKSGNIYLAPAGYHLQVEERGILSLSLEAKVCHVRPSIDVLFHSAASAYQDSLAALLLTGANNDGTEGICRVQQSGGVTVAQEPKTAEMEMMPASAIQSGCVDYVVELKRLPEFLKGIHFLKNEQQTS